MENDAVLLFSGGIDSYIGWHYTGFPKTVYFDLNTKYSEKEVLTVRELIPGTIIDKSLDLSSRQTDSEKAYIPFRNLYIATLAAKYGDTIIICGTKDDVVSDKNEFIFNEFSHLLTQLEGKEINVISPFWEMTKEDIVRWFIQNHPRQQLLETVSCYSEEDTIYCGKCPSCFRKWNALYANDIKLPFANEELMIQYLKKARKGTYIKERNESIIRCVTTYLNI